MALSSFLSWRTSLSSCRVNRGLLGSFGSRPPVSSSHSASCRERDETRHENEETQPAKYRKEARKEGRRVGSEDTLVKYWNTAGMSSSHIASWWQTLNSKSDIGPCSNTLCSPFPPPFKLKLFVFFNSAQSTR